MAALLKMEPRVQGSYFNRSTVSRDSGGVYQRWISKPSAFYLNVYDGQDMVNILDVSCAMIDNLVVAQASEHLWDEYMIHHIKVYASVSMRGMGDDGTTPGYVISGKEALLKHVVAKVVIDKNTLTPYTTAGNGIENFEETPHNTISLGPKLKLLTSFTPAQMPGNETSIAIQQSRTPMYLANISTNREYQHFGAHILFKLEGGASMFKIADNNVTINVVTQCCLKLRSPISKA